MANDPVYRASDPAPTGQEGHADVFAGHSRPLTWFDRLVNRSKLCTCGARCDDCWDDCTKQIRSIAGSR